MTSRSRKVWLGSAGILLALIGAAIYVFEWNMLRTPLARRVAQATGRTFSMDGDLRVQLARTTRVTLDGVRLGNASWSSTPDMAGIRQLDFTVELWPLLRGRVVLPEVILRDARVLLEKNAKGEANWDFGKTGSTPPTIGALVIDRGDIRYLDPALKTDFAAAVSTVAPGEKNAGMLKVSGRGRVKAQQSTIDGHVGGVLALKSATDAYAIDLRGTIGPTRARVHGSLIDPLHLRSESLNFELEGADMAQLFPLIGLPLPPTPPYKLSGHLAHQGSVWTFRKFTGRVGKSDLAGDFQVDRTHKPQLITADLVSRNLEMKDLGGFVGADRGEAKASPKPPRADRVLPEEPFSLAKLRVADFNVKFRGERVVTEKLPLEKMTASLKVKDGVLTLEPLNFGVAGGNVVSQIRMDARQAVIKTRADIAVKQLRLEKLFPEMRLARASAGAITGRAKLDATGNSVAKMLGGADGEAAVMMEGGTVSELLVRLVNLDVANALPVLLTGDKDLPVRCMVAHLKGKDGAFGVETLLLDTGKAVVTGTGSINFATEALDLKLVSKSKGLSLAALRGPITIKGTFKDPQAGPDLSQAAARGIAAVALGWFTGGIGALIPLVDLGGAKDSDCAAVIQEAGLQPGRKVTAAAPR